MFKNRTLTFQVKSLVFTVAVILVSLPTVSASANSVRSQRRTASVPSIGFSQLPLTMSVDTTDVVIADLNADGIPDLVTADGSNSLGVSLGNGVGTFQTTVDYTVPGGTALRGVTVGDFNGDGKPDIAVTYGGQLTIAVFLGNGDGTFQSAKTTLFGGSSPTVVGVATADFNGDDKLDVALVDCGNNTVWTLLGNGDGTFSRATQYPQPSQTGQIVTGDFNRDGKADVAYVGTPGGVVGALFVMLGNGDGTFQRASEYAAPNGALFMATGDLNGDGVTDIVVSEETNVAGEASLSVFIGNSDGTFQSAQQYATTSNSTGVAIGDFNGDGKLDVVVANDCGDLICSGTTTGNGTVSILFGNGDGTLEPELLFSTPEIGPRTVATSDLNRDGRLDIVLGGSSFGAGILLQTTVGMSSGALLFGAQAGGTVSPPQTVTITNTAATPLSISGIALGGVNSGDFAQTNNCGASLAAGASCSLNVTFSPLGAGVRVGLITLTDNALGSTQQIALTGTGTTAVVSLNPASLNFGDELVNQVTPVQMVTLTNTGNATLNISNMAATGDFLLRSPCPATVAVGATCTFAVAFKPSSKGAKSGAVTITDNAPGSPQSLPLSGTGTLVSFSPASLNFGNVKKGTTSAPQSITLTNHGTSALNVTKVSFNGNNAKDFAQTNNCGTSVAAKGSCTISVTFTPSLASFRQSNVAVYDSGGGSPQLTPVSGSGTN